MRTLLHIDTSPRGDRAISRRLTREFAVAWKETDPDGQVIYRDLGHDPVPLVSEAFIAAVYTPPEARSPELLAACNLQQPWIRGQPVRRSPGSMLPTARSRPRSEARSTNQGVGEGGRTTTKNTKPLTSPSSQSSPAKLEERESFGRKESEFGRQLRGAQIGFSELARNDERLVFQVFGALGVRE